MTTCARRLAPRAPCVPPSPTRPYRSGAAGAAAGGVLPQRGRADSQHATHTTCTLGTADSQAACTAAGAAEGGVLPQRGRADSRHTAPATCALRAEPGPGRIAAVLLEQQTAVFCPNVGVLTAVVLALVPLLRPFAWQSLLLPLLPAVGGMLDLIQVPPCTALYCKPVPPATRV